MSQPPSPTDVIRDTADPRRCTLQFRTEKERDRFMNWIARRGPPEPAK